MPIPSLLKQALSPGSPGFLIVCLIVWIVLKYQWPRGRRVERGWLFGLTGLYLTMGLPCVANALADRLVPPQVEPVVSLQQIERLIVLDGDNRVGRAQEAGRVWSIARPKVVDVLGGNWVVEALTEVGVPRDRIVQNAAPRTTRAQMVSVQRLVVNGPDNRTALIASRLQMPRVAALAKAANIEIVLLASPIDAEPPRAGLWLLVPSYVGLRASRDALYEHGALAFYAWRGWITHP